MIHAEWAMIGRAPRPASPYFDLVVAATTAPIIGVSIKLRKKVHSSPSLLFLPILSDTIKAPVYQTVKTIKKISSCILVEIYE